ncbi:MAG: UDP-N-acetylglucosamine 2-epimerase (non-hydrolyzing) [Ruminococcaceae bacterium]|nr:UDP-N-acetylglucosamine 2-epimerase (non-hydrolyzing) [Oscillospiraceae bacterium]
MKSVLVVLGTRPEAIKLCPLILELRKRGLWHIRVCSTGQHRTMLKDAMDAFDMSADITLDIMRPGQTLTSMGARLLEGMDSVLRQEDPSLVLVQGDTSTAFFAALAAFQHKIPVGHVEAGLRTYCMDAPFPEEFHRCAISLFAKYHFAPTVDARDRLLTEGKCPSSVFVTGNTVVDALRYTLASTPACGAIDVPKGKRLLIFTSHRRENLGVPMRASFAALRRIVEHWEDVMVLCPLHRNPSVRAIAYEALKGLPRIRLIEPPEIVTFHHLLFSSYLVITDSGGIQEEAVALGIPTLVTRSSTEREEGVRAGVLRLVGTDENSIVAAANTLLKHGSEEYRAMRRASSVFGDGTASQKIADILETKLI